MPSDINLDKVDSVDSEVMSLGGELDQIETENAKSVTI